MSAMQESARGREARAPQHIPTPGWNDVLWRSWQSVSDNNIFLAAGGVTYGVVLALFPGLAAFVSVYGLLMDPGQIQRQVDAMSAMLPEETRQLLEQQLQQLVSSSHGALGFGAIVGMLFALWSASRGMSGMMSALNMACEERERRGFFAFNAIALVLTIGMIVGGVVAIALIAGLPSVVQFMHLGGFLKWLFLFVQWPFLMVLLILGLSLLYRYAPSREEPQWRWVSPGALGATVLWLIASVAFTAYVANFSSYDKTYGTLGAAAVLLTWLYISSLAVLLGAVVNTQAELQTRKDTTTGEPLPMGRRGASAADRVGRSVSER